jgi:hypothetical protein
MKAEPVGELDSAAPREKVEDQDDHGQNQEDMNPPAECPRSNETQNPKNQEDDGDGPKHKVDLL